MSSFEEIAGPVHVSPLDEQSFEMHELFLSLIQAGFKERQALMLIAYVLNETQHEMYYMGVGMMDDDEEEEEEGDTLPDEELEED
jgi:uncharacterized protein YaeQ